MSDAAITYLDERFGSRIEAHDCRIDARGCAKVRQQMRGSFHAPAVDKPSLLAALTGPAMRLLKKGSDALRGETCEVFYTGSVAAP